MCSCVKLRYRCWIPLSVVVWDAILVIWVKMKHSKISSFVTIRCGLFLKTFPVFDEGKFDAGRAPQKHASCRIEVLKL